VLLRADGRLAVRALRGYERWGDPECLRRLSFGPAERETFATLLQTRRALLICDTQEHQLGRARRAPTIVRSWIGVPLLTGGRAIGLYSLDNTEPDFDPTTRCV
jgi:hypothetical protein